MKAYYATRSSEEAQRVAKAQASTRYRNKANKRLRMPVGRHEAHLAWALGNSGLDVIPQQACGTYRIDLGAEPLAIEVVTSGSRPENRQGDRIEYLMQQGWHVLYVSIVAGIRSSDSPEMKQARREQATFGRDLPERIVALRDGLSSDGPRRYINCDSLGGVKSEGVLGSIGELIVLQRERRLYNSIDELT